MGDQPRKPAPLYTAYPFFFEHEPLVEDFRALLRSGTFTNRGPLVLRLEAEIRRQLAVPGVHAVTCANATLGLELALKALDIRGAVLVPPLTFVASAHAIVNAGLEPVFCDIDPDTLCLSPQAVEKALSPGPEGCGVKIGAILPVHAYGNICDVEYFEALRARGIRIVYDAAHAFGTSRQGQPIGHWGDASVFSLHATKVVNACEGGVIATRDAELALKIQRLANFGFTGELDVELIGTNAKMSEVHALFGLHSLKQLPRTIEARKKVCERYRARLTGVAGIRLLAPQPGIERNHQYFPVLLESETARDALFESLKADAIFSRKYFYPSLNRLTPFLKTRSTGVPMAERVASQVLCLPLNAGMTEEQAEFVSGKILGHLGIP